MQTKVEPVLIGLHVTLCTLYGKGKSTDGYTIFDPCHSLYLRVVLFLYFVNIETS